MAQKVQVLTSCDAVHSQETDAGPRTFSVDGADYEVDLCDEHSAEFDQAMAPWLAVARKARRTAPGGRRTQADRQRSADIRAWARENGHFVDDRGRIPEEVVRSYNQAHRAA